MRAAIVRGLSVVVLVLLWEAAARLIDSRTFPPASAVLLRIVAETRSGTLPDQLGITLARVAAAFVLAMALGTTLGLAMGRWRGFDLFFDSWVLALLNLPALVIIVLAYVWLGLNDLAAVLAVALNKLPTTAVMIREGARALDPDLGDMARSFRFGRWKTLRHVVLPQLAPYLVAAARAGLALLWKIVLVVEILGRSDGVGFQIQVFFQLFDVTGILAYAVAFGAVVLGLEWAVLQPIERHATRWRR